MFTILVTFTDGISGTFSAPPAKIMCHKAVKSHGVVTQKREDQYNQYAHNSLMHAKRGGELCGKMRQINNMGVYMRGAHRWRGQVVLVVPCEGGVEPVPRLAETV